MVATRARWQVESNSSEKVVEPDNEEWEGVGEFGRKLGVEIRTGYEAESEGWGVGGCSVVGGASGEEDMGNWRPVGSP